MQNIDFMNEKKNRIHMFLQYTNLLVRNIVKIDRQNDWLNWKIDWFWFKSTENVDIKEFKINQKSFLDFFYF